MSPRLVPLTDEARHAIGGADSLRVDTLPFRIGRESRVDSSTRPATDRRGRPRAKPNNEAYLLDNGTPVYISREHLQIEQAQSGSYWVRDRGSAHGTVVDDNWIGGNRVSATVIVKADSVVVIGPPDSPYAFRFDDGEVPSDHER